MSKVLSIYSSNAFVEYLLPAINNSDISLTISKSVFSLDSDIDLRLEVVDNDWRIKPSIQYLINNITTKEEYAGQILNSGDLLSLTNISKEQLSIVVHETSSVFAVCEKFDIRKVGEIKIGNDPSNDIQYNELHLVSRLHAIIKCQGDRFLLEDKSSNGTFVNSLRITSTRQLQFGDCINIFGLQIIFLDGIIAVNTSTDNVSINGDVLQEAVDNDDVSGQRRERKREKTFFHRSPRHIPQLENDVVEIEPVPEPKLQGQQSLLMTVGPAMTMALPMLLGCSLSIYSARFSGAGSGLFMYTGLVTALGSAFVGTFWAVRNAKFNKKKSIADEQHRIQAYNEYLDRMASKIQSKYEKNRQAIRVLYPDTSKCVQYNEDTVELWNRNYSHSDVLYERLGIGEIDFQVGIDIPKEKFSLINDKLAEKPKAIKAKYAVLREVPVGIDLLQDRIIGLVGGAKKRGAYQVMKNLAVQIASTLCYTDVKLAFLYNESVDRECNWEFAKWLPHVWSQDRKTRYVASNSEEASDVLYELAKIFRQRSDEQNDSVRPHFVLFVSDPSLMKEDLIGHFIFEEPDKVGVTTLFMVEKYGDLPNNCSRIIQNEKSFSGMYSLSSDERIPIRFDTVADNELEDFARRLANIEVDEKEISGEMPSSLTFFEMYGIQRPQELNAIERWKKNRNFESMKALIGQKAGGAPCMLDVHEKYHGPHGLVAGTTGSGKSETLQTYILSLAANFSPDDVGFFIIDYKGGGMANLFENLPHMIGQISNLSGNQVNRAMISIKSENMRRQRIFNEHGVNNINLYTRLYKNGEAKTPIPHLFIIIDEFAELKREEPEFMKELISVAQVGRSLGVHLILATQKPSGTVDDNIWSNSKFRLCLRVQDRQDSSDMLHKPDAAYITQAGRGYLQVGNDELYELFQSGYSGALYDENDSYAQENIAQMISLDGKAALVGNLNKVRLLNIARQKWISQLLGIINETAISADFAEVYEKINSLGADYARNEYNTRRLDDLYRLNKGLRDKMGVIDNNRAAEIIIETANKNGIKLPQQKEKTQLDAVVEYLANLATENGYTKSMVLWLPVLPRMLYLKDLEGYSSFKESIGWANPVQTEWNLSCVVGLYDDPVNQAQRSVPVDISKGHYAIYGTVVSGKSTFLQTYLFSLINKYSSKAINIYAIDFSNRMLSAFENAPQVGGVVYEDDTEKLEKLFNMLETMISERKSLFKGGNYKQYVQVNGIKAPAVIIVIDNYSAFRSSTGDRYEDLIMNIAKNGINYGMFLMITAAGTGTNEVSGRLSDNIPNTICLEMRDKFAYADVLHTMHLSVLPENAVKGRGLVCIGESILEFQTALPIWADDDYKRLELIEETCNKMSKNNKEKAARKIPMIPENPVWDDVKSDQEYEYMQKNSNLLPVAYDWKTASIYAIPFDKIYCYSIIGKSRTGKTNLLKVAMASCREKGAEVIVIDYSSKLSVSLLPQGIRYLSDDSEVYEFFEKLLPIFVERNKKKREYVKQGLSDAEIYEKMQSEQKICIFIDDINEFISHIYNPAKGVGDVKDFIENVIDKGRWHNVFWFSCINTDTIGGSAGFSVYEKYISYRTGVNLGGAVSGQRILNFDYMPYTEQNKTEKPGIGLLPVDETNTKPGKIVVPLLKS